MNYVPAVNGMSYREIEYEAEKKLQQRCPQLLSHPGPIDVNNIWEDLEEIDGCRPCVEQLPDGIEGRTWPDGRVELDESTYLLMLRNDPRARFTVIHECAHAWLHQKQIQSVLAKSGQLTLNRRSNIPAFKDPEWQANAMAGAFLMPRQALKILEKSQNGLYAEKLQRTFLVSYSAASIRLAVVRKHGLLNN